VDRKGKTRKRYDAYLTPYEKLKSLPQAEQYLRPGVTMAELERIAQRHSDTEYALLVHQEKVKLFRSFAPRATVPWQLTPSCSSSADKRLGYKLVQDPGLLLPAGP